MGNFIPWGSQPLTEWTEKFARGNLIELDGYQTHFMEMGQGDPIILIHGFFYDTHMWDNNMAVLAQYYKVYVMDLWGFGYSTREILDYGYPLYARQLELFMDALNIPKATLIGQSMGAGTIIKFCTTHRERVEKIVLVDPAILPNKLPLLGRIANLPVIGELMLGLNSNLLRKVSLKTNFIFNSQHITDDYFEKVTRFHKVERTPEIFLKILRKQFFHTLDAEVQVVGAMDIPALVVGGRQDDAIPIRLTEEVHRILAGSRLEVIDQAGHCPNDEKADHFNRVTLEFLKE